MPKPLVIVESPAKARTIAGFLGRDFVVESSIGHIRDLPRRAADVPAAYKGSPVLWKKVMPRLSAGRVQSVATRIVVERERERMQFRVASYWDVEAVMEKKRESPTFAAALVALDGGRLATGRDFDQSGRL